MQTPYKRLEDDFGDDNHCSMWKKHQDNHSHAFSIDTSLPDQLNSFFAHFEDNSNKGPPCIPLHKGTATHHSSVPGQAGSAEQH